MSAGNWIKVEGQNRQSQELRRMLDDARRMDSLLTELVDKISQMTAGGADYTGMEAEYGLNAGEGSTVESLLASTKGELDAAPFYQQLISRLS